MTTILKNPENEDTYLKKGLVIDTTINIIIKVIKTINFMMWFSSVTPYYFENFLSDKFSSINHKNTLTLRAQD